MIKGFLRGEAPARALLAPILFSLGSRLESVSLRSYQLNPTKIANALRQIRNVLRLDGVTCYFDPFLEAEALGCKVEWPDENTATLTSPVVSEVDELRQIMRTPAETLDHKKVQVAQEVLQRLKTMLRDAPALMISLNGPLALAVQLNKGATPNTVELLEFAAEVTTVLATRFAEAGADVILLRETPSPGEIQEPWSSALDPIINAIRFYESLPVLLLKHDQPDQALPLTAYPHDNLQGSDTDNRANVGIALSAGQLWNCDHDRNFMLQPLSGIMGGRVPLLVTTSEDVPLTTGMNVVASVLGDIRTWLSSSGESPLAV